MKSLWVCYWYVKMPQWRCVEHGLDYITFYVIKYIAPLAVCSGPPAGSQQAARGTCIYETRLLSYLHNGHSYTGKMVSWYWMSLKGHLSSYGDCHCKDKTVKLPYFYNGDSYTGMPASLYWNDSHGIISLPIFHDNSNSMEILVCFQPNCNKVISPKFCTCHNCYAVKACALL